MSDELASAATDPNAKGNKRVPTIKRFVVKANKNGWGLLQLQAPDANGTTLVLSEWRGEAIVPAIAEDCEQTLWEHGQIMGRVQARLQAYRLTDDGEWAPAGVSILEFRREKTGDEDFDGSPGDFLSQGLAHCERMQKHYAQQLAGLRNDQLRFTNQLLEAFNGLVDVNRKLTRDQREDREAVAELQAELAQVREGGPSEGTWERITDVAEKAITAYQHGAMVKTLGPKPPSGT